MLVRISSMALRIFGLLALILGILRWIMGSFPYGLESVHQLFGILVVLSLWLLSYAILTAPQGRAPGLAIAGFVVGLIVFIVGATQTGPLYLTPATHWITQVIHLLLGLAAIGMGEAMTGRYRRLNKAAAVETTKQA